MHTKRGLASAAFASRIAALVTILSADAGCDDAKSLPGADASTDKKPDYAADSGTPATGDAGAQQPQCLPQSLGKTTLVGTEGAYLPSPTFAWDAQGVVGVKPGPDGRGYRVAKLDESGALQGESSLWANEAVQLDPRLAMTGGVVALVAQVGEGQRQTCQVRMFRYDTREIVQAPTRFSDAPSGNTILGEVQVCEVVATQRGFVLVWQQVTDDMTGSTSLFAQRVGLDGARVGDRVVLESALELKQAALAVTRDADRAVLVYQPPKQSQTILVSIDADNVVRTTLALPEPIQHIASAHDGYLVSTNTRLWTLDKQGKTTHGPYPITQQSLVAPLSDGYVVVQHEEFLVARTVDATLKLTSPPLGLSLDRDASARAVVFAADGSNTALVFSDGDGLHHTKLGCGGGPAAPGPPACPAAASLTPLDPQCKDPVCHVLLRLDYSTLGLRGWAVQGGPVSPVDMAGAKAAAKAIFDTKGEYLYTDVNDFEMSGPEAGLYKAHVTPSDFGAFALVSEASGAVVAAGGVVWSGRGRYWVPETWRDATEIKCGQQPVSAAEQVLDRDPDCMGQMTAPRASEAMTVALRTNLAAAVAARGALTARAYLYTPSVGACDSEVAEWLVVLTQRR